MLQAIEDDRLDSLQALAGPASALVRAVTGAVLLATGARRFVGRALKTNGVSPVVAA